MLNLTLALEIFRILQAKLISITSPNSVFTQLRAEGSKISISSLIIFSYGRTSSNNYFRKFMFQTTNWHLQPADGILMPSLRKYSSLCEISEISYESKLITQAIYGFAANIYFER